MDYTNEEKMEMISDLTASLNEVFGIVQSLTNFGEDDAGIERLMELYNMVETTLKSSQTQGSKWKA